MVLIVSFHFLIAFIHGNPVWLFIQRCADDLEFAAGGLNTFICRYQISHDTVDAFSLLPSRDPDRPDLHCCTAWVALCLNGY